MIKSLLIIDDKQEFINGFQITAQRKGYLLASGNTLDDLKAEVPRLYKEITAVILDIKALLHKDQSIENENFIGAAITWLDQNYPHLPRLILSGDEKALESFSKFYPIKHLLVLKKETVDIERMFEKIEEFQANHKNRIKTDDEREILRLISEGESDCFEFKYSFQFCMNDNIEKKY